MRHTLVFHTIRLAKRLQKDIGFKSPPLALSYSQASAILVLDSRKEISQSELAYQLHLEPASVVTLIDELENSKLVSRKSTNDDRRKYNIALTPKGKTKARQIKNKSYKLDNFLKSKLSPKETESFHHTLEKLTAALFDWKGGEK